MIKLQNLKITKSVADRRAQLDLPYFMAAALKIVDSVAFPNIPISLSLLSNFQQVRETFFITDTTKVTTKYLELIIFSQVMITSFVRVSNNSGKSGKITKFNMGLAKLPNQCYKLKSNLSYISS